jgi:serine/threonine-protein kinase
MEPERWQRIEALCEEALARPLTERASFVAEASGEDAALRDEVLSLLAELEADPDFLEAPLARLAPGPSEAAAELPAAIGRWRPIRRLGRGGMGDVLLAEPVGGGDPVALKMLRAGIASADVRRRFTQEERILANLRHPNIAALLDVTETVDGRPCFVLEYVAGMPITSHADLHRLGLRARIDLWLAVCEAVAEAHRNLVVHRDIKAANVLVTTDGVAKLLDFGIGKLLDNPAMTGPAIETATSDRRLTLDYAAPEQLRGEVVTTATDVHALGVLLHELVTGVHPFRRPGATAGEIERAILERVPEPPSAVVRGSPSLGPVAEGDLRVRAEVRGVANGEHLARQLRGDLDTIILMALRKEPSRRYATVTAFADDLRRHLRGLPVTARPDTLGYRTRRFVRRNAGSVAVGTLALLGLVFTTGFALLESRRASRHATAAIAQRDEATAVRGFLLEMFGATGGEQSAGESETVRELLDRQASRIDSLHGEAPLRAARLHEVVADAYERLGAPAAGEPNARSALALRRAAQGDDHPDVAAAENLLGWILYRAGERSEAEEHLRAGLAIRERLTRPDSGGLARSLNDLGVLFNGAGRYAEAETVLTRALAIRQAGHSDSLRQGIGVTANNLAAAHYFLGDYAEAGRVGEIAVHALAAAVGEDHQRTIISRGNLAAFRLADGDYPAAEVVYRDLLARQERLQGREHPATVRLMTSLATTLLGRPDSMGRDTALSEAEALLEESLDIQQRLTGYGPPQRGVTLDRLAAVRAARRDHEGARDAAREAVATLTLAHGPDHQEVAAATIRLGLLEAELGVTTAALESGRRGYAGLVETLGPDHPETIRGRGRLCRLMARIGHDLTETRATCDAAITALAAAPAGVRIELEATRRARP